MSIDGIAYLGQARGVAAIGMKPELADAHAPLGHEVKQETAYQFFNGKRLDFVAVAAGKIVDLARPQ